MISCEVIFFWQNYCKNVIETFYGFCLMPFFHRSMRQLHNHNCTFGKYFLKKRYWIHSDWFGTTSDYSRFQLVRRQLARFNVDASKFYLCEKFLKQKQVQLCFAVPKYAQNSYRHMFLLLLLLLLFCSACSSTRWPVRNEPVMRLQSVCVESGIYRTCRPSFSLSLNISRSLFLHIQGPH